MVARSGSSGRIKGRHFGLGMRQKAGARTFDTAIELCVNKIAHCVPKTSSVALNTKLGIKVESIS